VRTRPPRPPPPKRQVVCAITSIKANKKGPVVVHATCPKWKWLYVGAWGQILDATGKPMKDGSVVVKKVKGAAIQAEAPSLKQPVKATQVLFRVR